MNCGSLLAALEPLSVDEAGIVLDATEDPARLVREAIAALRDSNAAWTPIVGEDPRVQVSVEAELVALGIGHHDVTGAQRCSGLVALEPGAAVGDEPLGLRLQRRHPRVAR